MDEKKSGKFAMIARRIVDGDLTPAALLQEYPEVYMMHGRKLDEFFERVRKKPRVVEAEVMLIYGDTDIGKSQWVFDHYPDVYCPPEKNDRSNWFDKYTGQKEVILDDFSGQMGLNCLLRFLHKFTVDMPTKGSHTRLTPDKIFITSNVHPFGWYTWSGRVKQRPALKRRIHLIKTIGENYELVDLPASFWDEWVNVEGQNVQ